LETASILKPTSCLYLYGVVSAAPAGLEEICGIENQSSLFVIESEGLGCVVSHVPASEYTQRRNENPSAQLEWLTPRALRHDEILRHLSSLTTVVPFKFGTLSANIGHVQEILEKFQQPFRFLLDQFKDREEWTVKVYAEEALVRQHIECNDPELMGTDDVHSNQSEGHAYFLKKKREMLAANLTAELIAALGDDIHGRLQPCAEQMVCSTPCAGTPMKAHLAFSAALLVGRDRFAIVQEMLAKIESDYSGYSLLTELSGPWPPYSFTADLEQFQEPVHNEPQR